MTYKNILLTITPIFISINLIFNTNHLKYLITTLFLFCISHAFPQDSAILKGPAATATGNTTLNPEWAVINNPAALFEFKSMACFAGYENKLGLNELNNLAAGLIYPTSFGTGGIYLGRFGGQLFNISRMAISFAHGIGKFNLGTRINLIQIQIDQLGSHKTFSIDFGGLARVNNKISFGAFVSNLNQARYSRESHEKVPTTMAVGIGIKPMEKLQLSFEVEKADDTKPNYKPGLEYYIIKNLALRTGVSFYPFQQAFGIGFQPKKFSFDYAITNHNYLGFSHQISLSMNLKKKI